MVFNSCLYEMVRLDMYHQVLFIIKISDIPGIRIFRSSNLEEGEFMLRVTIITLSVFLLRIFSMFLIQLNSSLELVSLLSFGTSGSFGETP